MVPNQQPTGNEVSTRKQFPMKLFTMLQQLEREGSTDIVCWQAHGRAFRVNKIHEFETIILPRFFRHNKMSSFRRQLNIYDFNRVLYGRDEDAYYHEFFIRNRPDLLPKIERIPTKAIGNGRVESTLDPLTFYEEMSSESSTATSSRPETASNAATAAVADSTTQQQLSNQGGLNLEQRLLQLQNEIITNSSSILPNPSMLFDGNITTANTINNIVNPHSIALQHLPSAGNTTFPIPAHNNNIQFTTNHQQSIELQQLLSNSSFANYDRSSILDQTLYQNPRASLNNLMPNNDALLRQALLGLIQNPSQESYRRLGQEPSLFDSQLTMLLNNQLPTAAAATATNSLTLNNIHNNQNQTIHDLLWHSIYNNNRLNRSSVDNIDVMNLPQLNQTALVHLLSRAAAAEEEEEEKDENV